MRKILVGLAIAASLLGCVAMGSKYSGYQPISSGNAVLYLYRQSKFDSKAYCPDIVVDGKTKFCLKDGGFAMFELPAGRHDVQLKKSIMDSSEDVSFGVDMEEGKRYFMEYVPETSTSSFGSSTSYSYSDYIHIRDEEYSKYILRDLRNSL